METVTKRDYSKLYSFGFDGADIVVDYLRKLPEAEAKETYNRLLTFLNEIGRDAASWWSRAIVDTKAVDILTDQRILNNAEFVKRLGSYAAVEWFKAMAKTKAVDILTDQRILNNAEFVKRLGSYVAREWFMVVAETGAISLLTSENVLKFATEIGGDAAGGWFNAMVETKAVDVLTDPRILDNTEFVKKIGGDVAGRWFHVMAKTKAVDILTDPRILNNAEFVKRIGGDAAGEWFYVMVETKAVDILTDPRILNNAEFVKRLGSYAAWDWFYAMAKTKAISLLTSENVLKFATEIGGYAAREWFKAMVGTKAVDILTDQRILNNAEFVKRIGGDAAREWFYAIAETGAISLLTSENVLKFATEIGEYDAAWEWFYVMAKTKAVSLLTSEKVLKFATEIGGYAAGEWFHVMAKTKAVDILTDPRILNNAEFVKEIGGYAAGEWFDAIAEANTKGKKWSDYYLMIFGEISKKPSQYMELKPIKEKILEIAIKNWDGKSRRTQLDRYLLASALQRLNVDYSKIFGGKLEDAENYCNEILDGALKRIGINYAKKFTFHEKLLLLGSNLDKDEIRQLKSVAKMESNGYVIGVQNLSKTDQSTQKSLSLEDAVKYLVLGLNGTRDPDKKEDAKSAADWIKKTFSNVAGIAINEWNRIRKEKMKELSAAYNEFEKNPTRENAEKVFSIFKGKENEELDNIAVTIEALTKNYIVGKYMISFEGKSQFMLFDNSELAACAFLPNGVNRWAAPGYLLNSDVILVGFATVDKVPSNPDWNYVDKEVRKMNAVAICGIAEIDGNKVLYVDSFESNLHNWELIKPNYKFIIDSLIKVAENHGLDGVAVFTRPLNQTPREFVDLLRRDKWQKAYAKDITSKKPKPYFEGPDEMRDKIPVLLHLIRK
ncbi:MAG: hypothetical protein QW759_01855 [Candidatus Micrarchaeaceae archaeon]